jgi:hypothetical protein
MQLTGDYYADGEEQAFSSKFQSLSPNTIAKMANPIKFKLNMSQQPQVPIPSHSVRPFECVTFQPSAFYEPLKRVYTKVVDGRGGLISITDLIILPNILEQLVKDTYIRLKLCMGNPQMSLPFGQPKSIDVYFSESCFITINGKPIPPNQIHPAKKKPWVCVPPDITDLLVLKPGVANRIELRFSPMYPVGFFLI